MQYFNPSRDDLLRWMRDYMDRLENSSDMRKATDAVQELGVESLNIQDAAWQMIQDLVEEVSKLKEEKNDRNETYR